LSLVGMAYLAYEAGDWVVLSMMVPVLGGLLGFLRFNTYPARIFMGDAGSQFLGFYLGVCAIVLTDPTRGPYSPALVSLIWGLPILDTAGVMIQRLIEGRSPFTADKNHVHHKLLGIGFSHREAVLAIYGIQAALVALAYLMRWQSDAVVLGIYGTFAGAILWLFVRGGARPDVSMEPASSDVSSEKHSLEEAGWFSTLPVQLIGLSVSAFLVAAVFLPSNVPVDLGYLAAGLFILVAAGGALVSSARPMLIRAALYVGGTFVLYLIEQPGSGIAAAFHTPLNVFFLVLTALIMLAIRFGVQHRFQITPLDYLMVFLAFAIPFLPEMRVGEINLSILTAKMIVMFLAFELMLHALAERLMQFGLVSLWVLFMLGLRAWW
jgi:UDP-GlcNAc:undecaprenyl-phosphate GlcNAc-1-phosphate transferase